MALDVFSGPLAGPAALRPVGRTIEALDTFTCWLICALITLMVGVVSAQVALRYGLNRSIDWADEVSRLTFVWSIFLAIPLGIRARSHIGVEMLVARLPVSARRQLARFMALIAAAMLLTVAWHSAQLCIDQWDEAMASLDASAAWFIVPVVWFGVHGALHLIWNALFPPEAAPAPVLEDLG